MAIADSAFQLFDQATHTDEAMLCKYSISAPSSLQQREGTWLTRSWLTVFMAAAVVLPACSDSDATGSDPESSDSSSNSGDSQDTDNTDTTNTDSNGDSTGSDGHTTTTTGTNSTSDNSASESDSTDNSTGTGDTSDNTDSTGSGEDSSTEQTGDDVGPFPEMIDDFEDGDEHIYHKDAEGRVGTWFVESDGSKGTVEPKQGDTFKPIKGSDSQGYYAKLSGKDFDRWGARLGVAFHEGSGGKAESYEAKHNAITFKARGTGKMWVRYAVQDATSPDRGGKCPDPKPETYCDDFHYMEISLTGEWKEHTLWLADPKFQQQWNGYATALNPKASLYLYFSSPDELKGKEFDFEVDDIAFDDVDQPKCELEESRSNYSFAAPHFPFPQNQARDGIKPGHKCPEALADDIAARYDSWKKEFLRSNGDGHYIEMQGECGGNETTTTSEAHGYGMIIVALMAGHDPEAQPIFDSMLDYVDANPSNITPELMNGCVSPGSSAANTATDGDFDYAYALILAEAQWGGYASRAEKVISAIEDSPDIRSNWLPSAGDWDGDPTDSRSSDWMTSHFQHFSKNGSSSTWTSLRNRVYDVVSDLQSEYSPETGLVPDWIVGNPAEPGPEDYLGEGELTDDFGYNACRFPWRIAMDYGHHGNSRAVDVLTPLLDWAMTYSHSNPNQFTAGISLDGDAMPGPDGDIYTDLPFTGPIISAATIDSKYQNFVDIGWEVLVDDRANFDHDYYAESLTLLNMLYISGNWWKPE